MIEARVRGCFIASLLSVTSHANAEPREGDSSKPTLTIYGYAELDYIQDFKRVDPNWNATLRPTRIPTEPGRFGSDGEAILSVRQSRLGVKAGLPLAEHEVRGVFEIDMFGVGVDQGQTTLRLRHAYGEWASLLAGQTNSLFMDGDMFPNSIDYWGPAGMVLYRNPQLRWTPLSGTHTLAIALERSGTDVDPGTLATSIQGNHPLPDLTAHYRLSGGFGHLQVAGIVRQLAYEGATAESRDPHGKALGFGGHVSSYLVASGLKLRLSTVYGHGIANYMNDAVADIAPSSSTSLVAQPLLGVVAYWDQSWTQQFGSSIGYSFTHMVNQQQQAASAFRRGDYASATVTFEPVPRVLLGASYLWGRRTDYGGATGTDHRAQFSARFSFSSSP